MCAPTSPAPVHSSTSPARGSTCLQLYLTSNSATMQIWHDRTAYTPNLRLRQDFRHGVRLLRSSPAFSAVAVATCALAIGANTAMFSFVRGLLLRPLPYPDADRIVRVLERHPNGGLNSISTLNYRDWARQNVSFEYMAAEAGWQATVRDRDEPFVVRGARVT